MQDKDANLHTLKYVICSSFTDKFICLQKDALGENQPNQDTYLTAEHPILLENKEVMAQELVNGETIVETTLNMSEVVYSLCLDSRQAIMSNNLPVMTWAEAGWLEFAKERNLVWRKL